MKRISLSPESAGCLLVMYYGCTPCSLNDICRLCDMQERLAKNIFQELELNNLVCIDKNNKYNILCKNLVYDIFSILDCKLNKNKIFNALSFYYKKDYLTFLDVVIDVLELYESKKIYGRMFFAYEYFAKLISKVKTKNEGSAFNISFINKCMKIQNISFKVPSKSKYQILLYYKCRGIASVVGDKRTMSFIDINIGTLNITNKLKYKKIYFDRMENGYKSILSLCDKDIVLRCADKIILYYIIISKLNDAVSFLLYILSMDDSEIRQYIRASWFIYAAIASANSGYLNLCKKIILIGIKKLKIINRDNNELGTLYALLALSYFLKNCNNKGLYVIKNFLNYNEKSIESYSDLWTARALSFYEYKIGNIEKSWNIFKRTIVQANDELRLHANYFVAPFVLDLMFAYLGENIEPYRQFSFLREFVNAEHSYFLILQGTALLVNGRLKALRGRNFSAAEKKLRKALRIFTIARAPMRIANCLSSLALLHLASGQKSQALLEARQAKGICDAYSPQSLPQQLLSLLAKNGLSSSAPTFISTEGFMQQFLHVLRTCLLTSVDREDIAAPVLASLLGALGMVSGCVLKKTGGKIQKCCRINVSSSQSEFFIESLSTVPEHEDNALFHILERGDDPVSYRHVLIILSVSLGVYGLWFFCLEGEILRILYDVLVRNNSDFLKHTIAASLISSFKKATSPLYEIPEETAGVQAYSTSGSSSDFSYEAVFGSRIMRQIIRKVDSVAPTDTAVLLLGESGCGKEVVAQRLHEKSGRTGKFVCVNLSNLPYELFESECFGYEKGSFTGAVRQKIGLFELADNGTLFIDEIGDLSLPIQVKLLRVLQSKTFMRIGGIKSVTSNFRLVCATNKDLKKAIKEGKFREDLFYRINVVTFYIPPLRERKEDIEILSKYFLQYYAHHHGVTPHELTYDELRRLMDYAWPGNIRQLRNFIERLCLLKDGVLEEMGGPLQDKWAIPAREGAPDISALPAVKGTPSLQELADAYFTKVYKMTKGTVGGKNGISDILKISRTKAYAYIKRLGLRERFHTELIPNDDYREE